MFKQITLIGITTLTEDEIIEVQELSERPIRVYSDIPESSENCTQMVGDSVALLISLQVKIDTTILDRCKQLKYIGVYGTHPKLVDIHSLKSRGITITVVDNYCNKETAEFAFRNLLTSPKISPTQSIGIIGLGRIGKEFANLCLANKFDTNYYNRSRYEDFENRGLKFQNLNELIQSNNIISLHSPSHMEILSGELINQLCPGTSIINTCVGKVLNEQALTKWLKSPKNHIFMDAVAAMSYSQLSEFKNVNISPEAAYLTPQSLRRRSEIFMNNLVSASV